MRIFVSYRRRDTQDFAGRLADRLRRSAGVEEVFLDVDGIDPGEDFQEKLEAALAKCQFCLVVIGPGWRGAGARGPLIFEPGDVVRLEVRVALLGPGRIIPILANAAAMPGAEELPDDLRDLIKLNAISIRHADFDRDVGRLLDIMFSRRKPRGLRAWLDTHPIQGGLALAGLGMAIAFGALLIVLAVCNALTGRSLDEIVGGRGPATLLICTVLAVGAAVPFILGRLVGRRA